MTAAPVSLTVPEIQPGALLEIAFYSWGYTTRQVVRVTEKPLGPSLGTSGCVWIGLAPMHDGRVTGAMLQLMPNGTWQLYTGSGKRLDYVILAAEGAVEGTIPETPRLRRAS